MSKTPKSTSETPDSGVDATIRGLEAAVRVIGEDIEAAEKTKPGSKPRLRVPRLAAELVAITDAVRKREKLQLDALRDLTPGNVLTWARQQTPEVRARLVRDIGGIDSPKRGSVLG